MRQIQKQVVEWHKATFPAATTKAIFNKLLEELNEATEEILVGDAGIDGVFEELADVVIVTCSLADKYGIDFETVILDKMEVNKNRIWGDPDSEGDRPRLK